MDDLLAVESYGTTEKEVVIRKGSANNLESIKEKTKWGTLPQRLKCVFLPAGYPDSVSEDYLQYQIWDTVQAFCSSITGTLATQAILSGVGVGDESATVLAATLTWLMKDGTGMCGRIAFAWFQGISLDCDCKRWRLFADMLNDFAICLEIMAPSFGDFFTPVICFAGVCKSIVGVAGGATRAALTQHQARRNNMADVSAKDGSQETLVNLSALLCSLLLVPIVTGNQPLIWTLFCVFTAGHLYANYSAVRAVRIETFNQARMHIVTQSFLSHVFPVYSVAEANKAEPVFWKQARTLSVSLGASIGSLDVSFEDFQHLKKIFSGSKYLIHLDLKTHKASVVLHKSCSARDQMQACFHCDVLEFVLTQTQQKQIADVALASLVAYAQNGNTLDLLLTSLSYTNTHFPRFEEAVCKQGWSLHTAQLGADEWRAQWAEPEIEHQKHL